METLTMSDHREDVRDASARYTEYAEAIVSAMSRGEAMTDEGEARDPYDVWSEWPLEVEVFAPLSPRDGAPDLDRARVTFLMAVGGPTVAVEVDTAREAVTFRHSWGAGRTPDPARPDRLADETALDLWTDTAPTSIGGPGNAWLTLALYTVDGYR